MKEIILQCDNCKVTLHSATLYIIDKGTENQRTLCINCLIPNNSYKNLDEVIGKYIVGEEKRKK